MPKSTRFVAGKPCRECLSMLMNELKWQLSFLEGLWSDTYADSPPSKHCVIQAMSASVHEFIVNACKTITDLLCGVGFWFSLHKQRGTD